MPLQFNSKLEIFGSLKFGQILHLWASLLWIFGWPFVQPNCRKKGKEKKPNSFLASYISLGAMGVAAADSQFHVLAVDDSLIDRKLIERLLKISSFQVTTVDSGSKALEFLGWHEDDDSCNETSVCPRNHQQEVEVNLVITDYCMPGMTGYDLLKKIKECSYLRNIPVVIMSSENVPTRITRCLEEGAEEFFLKPVRLSDVNKLRPHMTTMMMMKTKDFEKPEKQEKQESGNDKEDEEEAEPTEQSLQQQQQQQQNNNGNNNSNSKRKSMDDGLPPLDRTRPRYNGVLTVMSN